MKPDMNISFSNDKKGLESRVAPDGADMNRGLSIGMTSSHFKVGSILTNRTVARSNEGVHGRYGKSRVDYKIVQDAGHMSAISRKDVSDELIDSKLRLYGVSTEATPLVKAVLNGSKTFGSIEEENAARLQDVKNEVDSITNDNIAKLNKEKNKKIEIIQAEHEAEVGRLNSIFCSAFKTEGEISKLMVGLDSKASYRQRLSINNENSNATRIKEKAQAKATNEKRRKLNELNKVTDLLTEVERNEGEKRYRTEIEGVEQHDNRILSDVKMGLEKISSERESGTSYREGNFRHYAGNIEHHTNNGREDNIDLTEVVWKIGQHGAAMSMLESPTRTMKCKRMDLVINMNTVLAEGFLKYAAKYSHFSADHSKMDLAALVEQGAAAMGVYAHFGMLKFMDTCGGGEVSIVPLQQHMLTSVPTNNGIYIPRGVDSNNKPGVFCAFVALATACNAHVITDMVAVDSMNGRAMYTQYNDYSLVMGVYDALCIMGAQYEACGAGDIFALAFTRGIHRVNTMVGHTDEGAWMRKVLRSGAFAIPFGGVDTSIAALTTIPRPLHRGVGSWRNVVDSYTLLTAAAVAECDPGIVEQGKMYPFTSCLDEDDFYSKVELGAAHLEGIRNVFMKFSIKYCSALAYIMGVHSNSGLSSKFLFYCTNERGVQEDRHLQYNILTPFFWIEPTCIFAEAMPGISSTMNSNGAFAYQEEERMFKMFADAEVTQVDSTSYEMRYDYTNLRSCPTLRWLSMREDDGLGLIEILGCDPGAFVCPGPHGGKERFEDPNDIVDMGVLKWRTGDNPVPKPGEALYVGKGLTVAVNWMRKTPSAYGKNRRSRLKLNVLPRDQGIGNAFIKITCSKVTGIGIMGLEGNKADVQRKVSRGSMALSIAAAYTRAAVVGNASRRFTHGDVDMTGFKGRSQVKFVNEPTPAEVSGHILEAACDTRSEEVSGVVPMVDGKKACGDNRIADVLVPEVDRRHVRNVQVGGTAVIDAPGDTGGTEQSSGLQPDGSNQ